MGKGTALVLGLVVGGVVGFVAGQRFPPAPACSSDHLIVVDRNSKSLPDTCLSLAAQTTLVWQSLDQTPIDVTIPDSAAGAGGTGTNPYPTKKCDGVSTCWSGNPAANLTYESVPYSLTLRDGAANRKIYGRIIINK